MRILLCCLFWFALHSPLVSQNFWVYGAGSIKEDEAMDVCYDNSGNIVSAGYFSGQTAFSGTINLNPAGSGVSDIYISKSTAAGQVLWAKKAGGVGSDKALSVAADASGNIFITGFYYGSATFGSITLNSVSGSQDGFVAKLDASGNFVWASSFGGSLSEQGNSITIDHAGNPVVTGQFQGVANFGSTALTSVINPITGLSSSDIFIAKYTPTGLVSWVRQGKAKFDDRGLDIATDASNDIYVCGQFSDTITFQNTHINTIMNASFLIKYSAAGQEQWFRKMAGVFCIANSLTIDNTNKIYVAGDFQGTLTYFGSPGNSFVSGIYSNKAFLLKVDHAGSFIWGKSESSTSFVSGRRVALDAQQDPYLFGEFGCTMKEYSDAYGTGVFNSIGFKDLFITKYNSGGTRQWFRHYGGVSNDRANGLIIAGINEPIMAGGYETNLGLPVTHGNLAAINVISGGINAAQPPGYCSAPNNYKDYTVIQANGYSDIFLFKGMDLTRNPYDYYNRSGSLCDLGFVGSCIADLSLTVPVCRDTIKSCLSINLGTETNTNLLNGIGPDHTYIWDNDPNATSQNYVVNTSGIHTVSVTTMDGCYSTNASVYVVIHPSPPAPVITDSEGENILQPPATTPIELCGTHTITLTGGHVQGATSYGWAGPYASTHDSIAIITQSGVYTFTVVNQFNCKTANDILVDFDNPVVPFTPKQKNDSVLTCQGAFGLHVVCDSTTNPQMNYPYNCLNFTASYVVSSSPGLTVFSSAPCNLANSVKAAAAGNYTYTVAYIINNKCTKDTIYFTGHVYIDLLPAPTGTISLTGGGAICPGDSMLLFPSAINLSPNTTYTMSPPLWVHITTSSQFVLIIQDTISGCTTTASTYTNVVVKPNPFITPDPFSSLICPNDSVKLEVNLTGATTYEWHGPGGIIPLNSRIIYSRVSGFYYCVVTDSTGCRFTTSPIEIRQFSSPYLIGSPGGVICNNQPVSLHVVTMDSTLIFWASPIFGSGATKVITSPGVYSCNVTMCGITSALSFTVTSSNPTANISVVGSNTLCPFDSVLLNAGPSGMTTYNWLPVNATGPSYTTHDPGDYTLQVTDSHGCTATASVNIALNSSVAPPTLPVHDTICAGQPASLSVTPSGYAIDWFSNPVSGPSLYTGNPYVTGPIGTQITYYASSVNTAGCHSTAVPVTAYIYNASLAPPLLADTTVCSGDTLKIISPVVGGAIYTWSGPGIGTVTSNSLVIPHAGVIHSGTYSLYLSGSGCTSPTSTVGITVINTLAPLLSGRDSICANTTYYAIVNPADPQSTYTWLGPGGFSTSNDSLIFVPAQPNQSGTYTVSSSQLGCNSATSTLNLTVLEVPVTPQISSNSPACVGDQIHLSFSPASSFPATWFGPNGFQSAQNPVTLPATLANAGSYSVSIRNVFCQSPVIIHPVQVLEYPILKVSNDTIACDDAPVMLISSSTYPVYLWDNGATTANISVTQSGIYKVTSANGNCRVSDSIAVDILQCSITPPNVFTPNGDGSNEFFFLRGSGITDVYCEIWDRWGLKMAEFRGTENGWNGWNMYSNKPCSDGTYFYIASVTNITGTKKALHGFITLVR
jgi:gliding motility-associated-like protein